MRHSLIAALFALAAGSASAACNVSAGGLNFGGYDPLATSDATSSSTITVACDDSPPPTVTIQIGPSQTGLFLPRTMLANNPKKGLNYNFFIDVGGGAVWGDGSAGTSTRSDRVFKNKPWTVTVYGRIFAGQDPAPGIYSDRVQVTIAF